MTIRLSKAGVLGLGLALVVGAGGLAYAAEDPTTWYSGGNATVADPDRSETTALVLLDADGNAVQSGSIDDSLAEFAAADETIRPGDTSASLFVALPAFDTAPAAWSTVQLSGTTKYQGATKPTGIAGDVPFVSLADALPLAQATETYPNDETAPSYRGVYELRLRTSSSRGGLSSEYASTYVKVSGTQWQVTDAPELGQTSAPAGVFTTAWGSNFSYGGTRDVTVSVQGSHDPAKGSVKLVSGTTTVSTSKVLVDGEAKLTIAKGKLLPGSRKVKVVFTTSDADVAGDATSAEKTYTIGKGTAPAPTFKVTKKITAKKAGTIVITEATPSGLRAPAGKVTLVISKGSKRTTITKTLSSGKATVSVPKRAAGTWKITVKYLGSTVYNARTAATKTYKVTSR